MAGCYVWSHFLRKTGVHFSGKCSNVVRAACANHHVVPQTMPISFQELLDTYELVSASAGVSDYQAILSRQTGKIYLRSEFGDLDGLEDELPDDIDDEKKYIAVPDKRDLDLGKPLVLNFALEFLPNDVEDVYDMFRRKGAYAKFKALLMRRNALDRWYEFERKATERALREWCEVNSIALAD